MKLQPSGKQRKILDFDIENRPLSYWYDGNCTAEITAIAWSWNDVDDIEVRALGEVTEAEMLAEFRSVFSQADMVTGHYIRRHDLPIINAGLSEHGLDILPSKRTQDTKLDLVRRGGQPSTQEYLGEILGVPAPKVGMSQTDWREANRLTPEGIAKTKERVVGDVRQHILIRQELVRRGWLKEPSVWNSVPGVVIIDLDE